MLVEVSGMFATPLSRKVDLHGYAVKLMSFAKVIFAKIDNTIVGIIAGYCNDSEGIAYVSLLVVYPDYRDIGIGVKLLDRFISVCKQHDMKKVKLDTEHVNIIARRLYERYGFINRNDGSSGLIHYEYKIL